MRDPAIKQQMQSKQKNGKHNRCKLKHPGHGSALIKVMNHVKTNPRPWNHKQHQITTRETLWRDHQMSIFKITISQQDIFV